MNLLKGVHYGHLHGYIVIIILGVQYTGSEMALPITSIDLAILHFPIAQTILIHQ